MKTLGWGTKVFCSLPVRADKFLGVERPGLPEIQCRALKQDPYPVIAQLFSLIAALLLLS